MPCLLFSGRAIRVSGVVLAAQQVLVIATTGLLCAALDLFFRFARLGVAMRATSQNQLAAYYIGIPGQRMNTLIWGLSAGSNGSPNKAVVCARWKRNKVDKGTIHGAGNNTRKSMTGALVLVVTLVIAVSALAALKRDVRGRQVQRTAQRVQTRRTVLGEGHRRRRFAVW